MKKTILSLTLISTLFFQGCDKSDYPFQTETEYIDLTFTKTKDATLFSFDRFPPPDSEGNYYVTNNYDYLNNLFNSVFKEDYILNENNKKVYIPRLGLHFKVSESDYLDPNYIPKTYLLFCDSKEEYPYKSSYMDKRLGFPQAPNENDGIHEVYFRIDKLRERGFIAEDRTKQEDLCILSKWHRHYSNNRVSGVDLYFKSNRLRFTAEEISSVVQEYDEAGFSQYDGQY